MSNNEPSCNQLITKMVRMSLSLCEDSRSLVRCLSSYTQLLDSHDNTGQNAHVDTGFDDNAGPTNSGYINFCFGTITIKKQVHKNTNF